MRATLKGGKDHGTQEEHKKKSLVKTKYLALQKNMGKESKGVFGTCVWKYVFCYLKTCVEIHMSEKLCENVCNVI